MIGSLECLCNVSISRNNYFGFGFTTLNFKRTSLNAVYYITALHLTYDQAFLFSVRRKERLIAGYTVLMFSMKCHFIRIPISEHAITSILQRALHDYSSVFFINAGSDVYLRSPSLSLSCFELLIGGVLGRGALLLFVSLLKKGELFLEFLATSLNTGEPMCSCIYLVVYKNNRSESIRIGFLLIYLIKYAIIYPEWHKRIISYRFVTSSYRLKALQNFPLDGMLFRPNNY